MPTLPIFSGITQLIVGMYDSAANRMFGENILCGLKWVKSVQNTPIAASIIAATANTYDSTGALLSSDNMTIDSTVASRPVVNYVLLTGPGRAVTAAGTYRLVYTITLADMTESSWEQTITIRPTPF